MVEQEPAAPNEDDISYQADISQTEIGSSPLKPIDKIYNRLDWLSDGADLAVIIAGAFYAADAFTSSVEPNLQSILPKVGFWAGHLTVTSGIYLALKNRLNARLHALT